MEKEHEFCLRCGRKLKNPEARQKGYGPVCERKMAVIKIGIRPLIGAVKEIEDEIRNS